jgi:hypothetical protein
MTPPKKPEWFELTESDRVKPRTSVKRSARGALLALPLLLIGVGVVVAQGTDKSPSITSATPSLSANVALANPSIAIPPTSGEDVDDDYEDDNEDDEEGEDD